ncbi:hypothetical protein [Micromonospora aurantiaca (nom. illeg.)]|uniref:hypothetical protein n=1 Tax=Micromonospora aurantiaca (nom. illeg.) TaxID=47850 RepID=UPI0037BA6BC3
MNFLPNDTLAGYAPTAVDLRTRMVDYQRSPLAAQYLQASFGSRLADHPSLSRAGMAKVLDAVRAITTDTSSGRFFWAIAGWADHHDAHDPAGVRRRAQLADRPDLARQFGPYVLTDFTEIPIGRPVYARPDLPVLDGHDRDWEAAPDGQSCIDETTTAMRACAAVAYAFWRIQAQPLATVAAAPWTARRGGTPYGPTSATTPAWSCCAAPAPSPNRPTASPSGTTGCGSSSAATAG